MTPFQGKYEGAVDSMSDIVDGNLTATILLVGGFTTRLLTTDPGVEVTGAGVRVYKPGGGMSAILDAVTGNNTLIGEFGTALPGDVGLFAFSNTFGRAAAKKDTNVVLQFNVAATRDQPSIQANTVAKSGIGVYSGANINEKESVLRLDNGSIQLGIEDSADSMFTTGLGARLTLNAAGLMQLQTAYQFGTVAESFATLVTGDATYTQLGYRSKDGTNNQGVIIYRGGSVRLLTNNGLDVISPDGTLYRSIYCKDVNPPSDRASKRAVTAPKQAGLDVLRAAPVYEWAYVGEDSRQLGPMAEDLPPMMTSTIAAGSPFAGMKAVSMKGQIALVWQAIQELDVELDAVPGLRVTKPTRATRKV